MFRDRVKKYAGITLAVAFAIVIAICVFFIIFKFDKVSKTWESFIDILMPFIYGAVIAYILRPICNIIENSISKLLTAKTKLKKGVVEKISRWAGIIMSILAAFLVIYILIVLIAPQLISTVDSLLIILPQYFNKSVSFVQEVLSKHLNNTEYLEDLYESVYEEAYKWMKSDLLPNMQTAITSLSTGVVNVVNVVKNILIGLVVSVYLLYNRRKFLAQLRMIIYSIFSEKWAVKIGKEARYTDRMFGGFINGKLIDSLIIGILCYIILCIVKVPYPLLIAVIIGITNIIPFFGPFIGAVPCVMLIFILSPIKTIYFIIIIICLQIFDGNILGPKILGEATGIDSFWVLFSVTFFGGIFGIMGMIIGVPLFAVLYDIVKQFIVWGLNKNKKSELINDYENKFDEKFEVASELSAHKKKNKK